MAACLRLLALTPAAGAVRAAIATYDHDGSGTIEVRPQPTMSLIVWRVCAIVVGRVWAVSRRRRVRAPSRVERRSTRTPSSARARDGARRSDLAPSRAPSFATFMTFF